MKANQLRRLKELEKENERQALVISERRACRALSQNRSTQRRPPAGQADEVRLTADIVDVGAPIQALWLSPYHRLAARRGLGGERQAHRADLAVRRA